MRRNGLVQPLLLHHPRHPYHLSQIHRLLHIHHQLKPRESLLLLLSQDGTAGGRRKQRNDLVQLLRLQPPQHRHHLSQVLQLHRLHHLQHRRRLSQMLRLPLQHQLVRLNQFRQLLPSRGGTNGTWRARGTGLSQILRLPPWLQLADLNHLLLVDVGQLRL